MDTLDQPVKKAVKALVGSGATGEDIYYQGTWPDQRDVYAELKAWYDGEEWSRTIPDLTDPITGKLALQWPLQVNPIAKVCRIHRAVMMGMQAQTIDEPQVATLVTRSGLNEAQRAKAETLQRFVNRVWTKSHAQSIQFEAGLLQQIYGGHVFRVKWEPFNTALPHRISIRSLRNPGWFYAAATDPVNDWDLLDAYVGYPISKEVAFVKYGIHTDDDTCLYLEHWTKAEWKITVDGKVPTMKDDERGLFKLEGENAWGIIPIVYVPHERDGSFLGRSVVDGNSTLIGLSKELNARLADKGESLQAAKSILWVKNSRTRGLTVQEIDVGGQNIELLDIGDAGRMPNSPEPEAGVLEPQGIPTSVASFPDELWGEIMRQGDVARVAFGDDDVSGGRITGPVTAYRMWPTMQHTMVERAQFHEGVIQVAHIVLTIGLEKLRAGEFKKYRATPPDLSDEMLDLDFSTGWRPMIPVEELQRATILDNQLRAGGLSLVTYLRERGVQDPEAEAERIWEDRERDAEIEAKSKPQPIVSPGGQEETE